MLFIFGFPDQQSLWVGQEGAVNESQADVVTVDADLTDAGADRSAALLEVVAKTFRVDRATVSSEGSILYRNQKNPRKLRLADGLLLPV